MTGGGDNPDDAHRDGPHREVPDATGTGSGGASDAARNPQPAHRIRAGTLLIASPDLIEPTFARTVIYMIEHNDAGSIGVVVNRMSQTAVHNVTPGWAELAASPRALFVGGPVKQDAALCLGVLNHGVDADFYPGLRSVIGRVVLVDLDADPESLTEALEGIRLFAGYSGWGIGQLDAEMAQDSWLLASALPRDLLAPPTTDVWSDVLRRQPWPLPLLSTHPLDTSMN
ncbi:YqgE/AlgH family protein [Gordonia sinesedis]